MNRKSSIDNHKDHPFTLVEGPFQFGHLSHAGKFVCTKCNVQIKWTRQIENDLYKQEYKQGMTYEQFGKRADDSLHAIPLSDPAIILLTATYPERQLMRDLGASWDPYHKVWYTTVRRQYASKLKQWMLPDDVQKLDDYLNKQSKT